MNMEQTASDATFTHVTRRYGTLEKQWAARVVAVKHAHLWWQVAETALCRHTQLSAYASPACMCAVLTGCMLIITNGSKRELVFHTPGGYQNSSNGGCCCLVIPHCYPNILGFSTITRSCMTFLHFSTLITRFLPFFCVISLLALLVSALATRSFIF